jgi:hypothetical protein
MTGILSAWILAPLKYDERNFAERERERSLKGIF